MITDGNIGSFEIMSDLCWRHFRDWCPGGCRDERMELHCEGEDGYSIPHPERPDRVRAVMARLTASALAGAPLAHQGGQWDS